MANPFSRDIIIPLLAALVGSATTWALTGDWEAQARASGWVTPAEWHAEARRQLWLPNVECPAYPIAISITSPGDGVTVRTQRQHGGIILQADFVIRSTRPFREGNALGVIVSEAGSGAYHLLFPYFNSDTGTLFRHENFMDLPFTPTASQLNVWAIVVPNKSEYGAQYSSLEQIRGVRDDAVLSSPIKIGITSEP